MFYNKAFACGTLTEDPKLIKTQGGKSAAQITIEVKAEYQDRDGNTKYDTTTVDIDLFGKIAETVCQYLHKGDPAFFEGRLKMNTWKGGDGKECRSMVMIGQNMQFMSDKKSGGGLAPRGQYGN